MAYLDPVAGARREGAAAAISAADIAAGAVGTSEIDDGAIATADIANGAVTRAKQSAAGMRKSVPVAIGTVPTAVSNTDVYLIVPETGTLDGVDFSCIDALAAHDTNYVTFAITNLGQAGAGRDAMLAATDANTSKATGGAALAANTKRSLTLHGTAGNLAVVAGDRLRIRVTGAGTLANTLTGGCFLLRFGGTT